MWLRLIRLQKLEKILWPPLMILIGAIDGPKMFLTYPEFTFVEKAIYCAVLVFSLCMIVLGIKIKIKFVKTLLIVFGIALCCLAGLAGLSTGTKFVLYSSGVDRHHL